MSGATTHFATIVEETIMKVKSLGILGIVALGLWAAATASHAAQAARPAPTVTVYASPT